VNYVHIWLLVAASQRKVRGVDCLGSHQVDQDRTQMERVRVNI